MYIGYFKKQNKGTQPLRAFIGGMKVCACCAFNKGLIGKSQCCAFMFTCHALQPINYVVFSVLMYLLFISKCTKCSILHSKAHVVVYSVNLQCVMSIMYSYVAMWEYPFNAHSSA